MPFCSFLRMYDVFTIERFWIGLLSIGRGWMTKDEKEKPAHTICYLWYKIERPKR